jgi:CRISPR-associated protein Csm2
MATHYQQRHTQGHRNSHGDQNGATIDTNNIQLQDIKAELFDDVARMTAEIIADNRNSNKPTQLRRFYDEIVMWENKTSQHPEKFTDYLPFIRMLNAKAAYAKGRKLVDDNYVKLLNDCLKQVDSDKTMRNFKLFMEAFMGFYKEKRPKD